MSGAVRGGQQFAQRRVIVDGADDGCVNLFRSERTGSGIHRADIRRHSDALEGNRHLEGFASGSTCISKASRRGQHVIVKGLNALHGIAVDGPMVGVGVHHPHSIVISTVLTNIDGVVASAAVNLHSAVAPELHDVVTSTGCDGDVVQRHLVGKLIGSETIEGEIHEVISGVRFDVQSEIIVSGDASVNSHVYSIVASTGLVAEVAVGRGIVLVFHAVHVLQVLVIGRGGNLRADVDGAAHSGSVEGFDVSQAIGAEQTGGILPSRHGVAFLQCITDKQLAHAIAGINTVIAGIAVFHGHHAQGVVGGGHAGEPAAAFDGHVEAFHTTTGSHAADDEIASLRTEHAFIGQACSVGVVPLHLTHVVKSHIGLDQGARIHLVGTHGRRRGVGFRKTIGSKPRTTGERTVGRSHNDLFASDGRTLVVADTNHGIKGSVEGHSQAKFGQGSISVDSGLNLGGQFSVSRGFVGIVVICLEVNGVFFAVQGKLEASVRVVVQRISVAALSFRQRTHGVDELKAQSASRGGVFGFQILVVEVHRHIHIAGIGVAHADGHVVGVDAHVFDDEVGAAILRPQLQLPIIASLNTFGVNAGSSIVSNVVGTVVSSIGLSAELDHFHVLDFGGGGKESGGAKVGV